MDVMVEFTLESVEGRSKLAEPIAEIVEILEDEGLEFEVHGAGTTIVGEMDTVLECLADCHQALGEDGRRVKSTLTLEVREEWSPGSIQTQAEKVKQRLTGIEAA